MPINFYDMQRFDGIKVKENIRKQGSPDRFGKNSSTGKGDKDKLDNSLLGKLLKPHTDGK